MAMLTRRPFTVITAGLLGVMVAVFLALPLVSAQAAEPEEETATDEPFLDEGWWLRYRNPEAAIPKEELPGELPAEASIPGQTARGSTNPYPGEYVRVSAVPGEEGDEAVAGFGFDLLTIGEGFPPKITGGEVTFVLAPSESKPRAGDGANAMRNEENAAMHGCLATNLVIAEQAGNWEDKPPFDCEISSPLELVEGSDPLTWTMDLAPFLDTWAEPNDNYGFIVARDPEGDPDGQAFHVAFPTTLNDSIEDPEKHPPVTATFTYEKEVIEAFGDMEEFDDSAFGTETDTAASEDFSGDTGSGTSGTGSFDSPPPSNGGSSFGSSTTPSNGTSGSFDGGDAPVAAADEPVDDPQTADDEELFEDEAVEEEPVQDAMAAEAEDTGSGMNLGYVLLPLLGLGLATTLGYSLSKDPELPVEREGAVTKLMQRRQAQGAIGPSSQT